MHTEVTIYSYCDGLEGYPYNFMEYFRHLLFNTVNSSLMIALLSIRKILIVASVLFLR